MCKHTYAHLLRIQSKLDIMAAYEEKFYLADTTVPKASLKDYH